MKWLYRTLLVVAIALVLVGMFGPTALKWLHHDYYSGTDPYGPFWAPFFALMEFRTWIFVTSACFGVIGLALRFSISNSDERNKQLSKT